MRTTTDLARLQVAAAKRLANIQALVLKCAAPPTDRDLREIALALIYAQSVWSGFARYFFVSSILGARRLNGSYVTTTAKGLKTEDDAIAFAVGVTKPRAKIKKLRPLDEPPWHQAWVLPRLAKAAGLSNEPQVIAAYAVPGRALEDLPTARNFYAHQSHRTAMSLQSLAPRYSLPASTRPGLLPGQKHPARPMSIASTWLAELSAIVRLLPM